MGKATKTGTIDENRAALIYELDATQGRREPDGPAVLYGRNSQKARRGPGGSALTLSVDSQLEECGRRVKRQKWPLVDAEGQGGRGVFRDDGISASEFSSKVRPDWQRVMDLIEQGRVGILVIWELSRTTRDRPVWAALMAACQANNVLMDVGGKTYDPNDPDEAFMLDLQAMQGVRESKVTNKRVNRLVRARAVAGAPHGRVTYGYRSVYDPDTGKLIKRTKDPKTSKIAKEILTRLLAGETHYGIAKDLNARGISSPGGVRWTGTGVRELSLRPAYAGLREFRGQVVGDATWKPIISKKDHFRLVAMAEEPERKRHRQDTRVKHLLVGIAECGKCKRGRMECIWVTKRQKHTYRCNRCFGVSRGLADVDELIETLMKTWLGQDDVLQELAKLDDDGDASSAAEEAAELKARLERFYSRAAKGQLSDAGLARIEAELLPQIEKAERLSKPATLPAVVYKVAGPNAATLWDDLDILEKRTVLIALCRVIILPSAKRGRSPFDPRSVDLVWRTDPEAVKHAQLEPERVQVETEL